jgi:hypothetical protein
MAIKEDQTTEFKEIWKDEYLRNICGSQIYTCLSP